MSAPPQPALEPLLIDDLQGEPWKGQLSPKKLRQAVQAADGSMGKDRKGGAMLAPTQPTVRRVA